MSTTVRPVLIGVGEYGVSDAVLAHAIGLARRSGAGLRLVHVLPRRRGTVAQPELLIDYDAFKPIADEMLHRVAESARQLGDENLSVEVVTAQGSVAEVLSSLAGEACCVVLQRRRLSHLHRVFTGSVSTAVAGRAAVPVLTVPEFWAPWPTTPPLVTVGVDGGNLHRELLERAFEAAEAQSARLRVLSAWSLPIQRYDGYVDPDIIDQWVSSVRRVIENLVEAVTEGHPDVDVLIDVEERRPADSLVEATRRSHLLILGRLAHRFPLLGSLTRAVLREALCPVMLFPLAAPGSASP